MRCLLKFEGCKNNEKQRRMDIAPEQLTRFNDDADLLKKVITGDKSWLYVYDIERKAFCYDWWDKGNILTEAVGDTKKRVSEVFLGFEKTLASISIISERVYFEGEKIVIDK